ncbi:uncharacterized protein LOC127262568 [Andrographis paniculata]|uniref:uncharacterized protein LOC127262568 n=1 Tax=Andrographis paniculata TaxID=175694 RepID=UPI0021E7064D|nr:uncharacterized protein LOC127262568 [Andrographis paniculata]XP_051147264.1 uncharacterized protein LOC127262568 [Andrographis paniculata]XP_051147265.1 uncharacterized protein LOC127262568 [Andrographis paniculata]
MAKGSRGRRGIASRQCRPSPYPLSSCAQQKSFSKTFKKDWEDATCSVCMEHPHNAVLLLCSSYENGCRPYMCGTSFRYSNCLDQYKKACTKAAQCQIHSHHDAPNDSRDREPFSGARFLANSEATGLACPLCRGQVKGWTVVQPAREYLNYKKRNCVKDDCTFVGTYKELRKHVRAEHPSAKPHEVDPTLEHRWRTLERERERDDVISNIRSSMPGAVVFGDYVIEGNHFNLDSGDEFDENGSFLRSEYVDAGIDRGVLSMFFLLQAFGSAGGNGNGGSRGGVRRLPERDAAGGGVVRLSRGSAAVDGFYGDSDGDDGGNGVSLADRLLRNHGRALLRRAGAGRRRRHRNEGNDGSVEDLNVGEKEG